MDLDATNIPAILQIINYNLHVHTQQSLPRLVSSLGGLRSKHGVSSLSGRETSFLLLHSEPTGSVDH